jgi:hypothetical protein
MVYKQSCSEPFFGDCSDSGPSLNSLEGIARDCLCNFVVSRRYSALANPCNHAWWRDSGSAAPDLFKLTQTQGQPWAPLAATKPPPNGTAAAELNSQPFVVFVSFEFAQQTAPLPWRLLRCFCERANRTSRGRRHRSVRHDIVGRKLTDRRAPNLC